MSRTHSRFNQDLGFPDAKIFFGVNDIFVQAGGGAITRNAVGDISINQGATQVGLFDIPFNSVMERVPTLGVGLDLQEQFGTAAGVAGPSAVANTSDPADVAGRPPFTGASQLTARTGFIAKGLQVTDITLIYLVTGAALTLHTIRVDKATFVNNIAVAVTAILANAANGLQTPTQANPYVTKVALVTPFNVTDNSELIVEIAATTQGGGAYRLYGAIFHCNYNLN